MTKKEPDFAYISDTEETSARGWETFNDCGTEAFRLGNHPLQAKRSKTTTKVVRTYKLKRILRVDRQPGFTDEEDGNPSDTDDDTDYMISSDEEEETKVAGFTGFEADEEVRVPRPSATVKIRDFNLPIRRSASLAEPTRGGRSVSPARRVKGRGKKTHV